MDDYDFHPEAAIDLEDVWDYIADSDRNAANRVVSDLMDTVSDLVAFPHLGHVRPDLTSRPLRFMHRRGYLIAYAPNEKPFWVIAIIHGRRSPRVIAAILRGRE